MADRRFAKSRRSSQRRNLCFESLDRREVLATLTVGSGLQFPTIQGAVNNAAPGDTIQIAATSGDAVFSESVNLSLMGSARPGGVLTGNLTIAGDTLGSGTTIVSPGTSATNNSIFYNTSAFTGNLTFANLTLRPLSQTALDDIGIRLDGITGNISITDVQVFDATDAAIQIRNSQGPTVTTGGVPSITQSRLLIQDVNISRNLDGVTTRGIVLDNLQMLGLVDNVAITEVGTVGVEVKASGSVATSLTMHNVDIDGYGDTFKGNDGLVIDATQTSSVLVAVAFSDFSDLPGNSIDATASDSAKLYVNVYGNSAISNAGLLGAEPVVARVAGEPATRFTARNNAQLSVGMIDNIFTSINATAIQVQALNTSLVNVSIHDNLMTGIGDSVGHEVIWIGGNRTASAATNQTFSATVNARITDNVIFDAYTAGIRVNADGGSTYNTAIHRNSLSYGEFYLASAFGIDVFATTFHTAKVNLAMTGNDVQILPGAAIGTMRVRVDSGTPVLKVEMTGSNIASFLTANNTLSAAAQVTVPQPTQQQVYVAPIGSFVSRIPLRLGDQLWLDVNKNGVLDPGALEKGVSGGIMTLTGTETEGGAAVSMRMITEEYLGYQFGALLPGTYTLKLLAPDGLDVTVADAESASTVDVDEDVDSDFSTDTRSVKVTLLAGVDKTNIDAGLVPASPWKNPDIGTDVNRDGFVAPLDALIVIIDLNAFGSRQLPAPTTTPTSFVDVNGDGFVTPLDALVVIIRLNSPQSEAGPQSEPIESVAALSQPIYTLPIVSPDFFYTALPAAQPDADGEEEASSLDAFFADLGA